MCRASLAAGCLLMLSFAGPWSARFLRERKPRQSLTGRRIVGLAPGNAPHLRLFVHSVQLDGTSTALLLIALQASAAAMGASEHALAASCSDVEANLKSRGMLNPLAFSQPRSVNSLTASLMSQETEAGLSLHGVHSEQGSVRRNTKTRSDISRCIPVAFSAPAVSLQVCLADQADGRVRVQAWQAAIC